VLLSWLVARANQPVGFGEAADMLWSDSPPVDPVRAVRGMVRRIRQAVGDQGVVTVPGGYLLRAATGEIDARIFEQRIDEGVALLRRERRDEAETPLRAALGLWRGEPHPELQHHPVALGEITHLWLLRLAATEHLIGIRLTRPVDYELVADLESLTARHPERERLWRQLALALYRTGRQAEALRVFARLRLAAPGGPRTADSPTARLEHAISAQDPALELGELPER
jgi:DNA-binding SARP family transcriptional activator